MNHHASSSNRRNLRIFVASFLSYMLLTSQLAPMALTFNGAAVSNAPATRPLPQAVLTSNKTTEIKYAPVPVPLTISPAILAPNITASKVDTYPSSPGGALPGEIITYSITINNAGPDPATNVTLTDTVDPNTAIVGTPKSTPIGFDDAYGVIGNVGIQVPDGTSDLLANDRDPDTDTNAGLTITTLAGDNSAPFAGTSANGGQVTAASGDGSFQYNPPPGSTATDTFTYTVTDSDGGTSSATVTLTITGVIWFVNSAAATGGDGRLTNPFNCYTGTSSGAQTCFSDTAADDPGDIIFLFSGSYIGGNTLLNNQRLIGQGATDSLANVGGVTVPTFSDPLPATGGASPTITTAIAATAAAPLGQGNHLRGFTVGNTTGAKISGNNFGTLTVGNNASPDVILNGTGQALNLTNGTFAATSAFSSVTTTSSGTQGISLTTVAGTVAFGSTTVSGSTTQGILVTISTADINFGSTSVSGGTDGVSLQNNSAGTRTFGTLSVSNNSGVGFLHAVGGGSATITGATLIPAAAQTAPVGTGIDIQSLASGTAVTFAATTVNKGNAGTGINLGSAATGNAGNVTFNSLAITTANGSGLVGTGNTGQINVTTNAGSISSTNGPAINITKAAVPATPIALNFNIVSSTNSSTQGINLDRVSGNMTIATTTVTNPTGIGVQVQNTSAGGTMNFGNTTANQSGSTGVFLNANAGGVTFADLDINPDAGVRAFHATSNTGTTTSTSGTIGPMTDAQAVDVTSSALNMVLTSVTTDNTGDADSCVNLSGATGTLNMQGGTLTGGAGAVFNVSTGSINSTYSGGITQNSAARVVNVDGTTGGTIAFNTGTITGGASSTGVNINNANGNVSFANLTLGTSGSRMINQAVTTTGGTGTYSLGAVSIFTNNVQGISATNADGTLNSTSGTVDATGAAAINIDGPAGLNTLGISLTTVNSTGSSTNGIALRDTNGTFAVTGNTAGLCGGQVTVNPVGTANGVTAPNTGDCSGGTISSKTGDGVSLNNVVGVLLTRMLIQNNLNSGVFGDDLTNFSLISSFIDNNSDVANPAEANLRFNELLGTCVITNSTITGASDDEIRMTPASGTLTNLAISGTVIGNDLAGENGNGLTLSPTTTASVTVNMTNSVVKDVFAAGVVVNGDGTTSRTFNVSNTSFLDMDGVGISMQGSFSADLNFTISNNTFLRNVSNAINVSFGTTATNDLDVLGTISGNAIGDATVDSGSRDLIGIAMESQGDADTVIFVNSNIIRHSDQQGFFAQSRLDNDADAQVGRFDLILRDNAISDIDDNTAFPVFAVNGVHVDGRNTTTLCLDSFSNDSANVGAIGDFLVRRRDTSNFILERFDDGDANFNEVITNTATIATFHNGQNDAGHTTDVLLSGTAPAGISEAPDNTCRNAPTPGNTLSPFGFLARNSIGRGGSQQDDFDPGYVRVVVPDELKGRIKLVPPAPRPRKPEPAPETDEIRAPGDVGSPSAPGDVSTPGAPGEIGTPGAPASQSITARPFISSPREQTAKATTETSTPTIVSRPPVETTVSKPARTTPPKPVDNPGATPPVIGPGGTSLTWDVGTLPAGRSVTITFTVQVESPYSGPPQVSNQGSISFGGGGGPVLTDDPSVGGASDPTVTPIAVPLDAFIRDARVAEPTSGTTSMLFSVALSAPATQLTTINYSTANGTAVEPGDYVAVSNGFTVFQVGEQMKVIPITVNSDGDATEVDEDFTVTISANPTEANVVDSAGTGTITVANPAGEALISEIRTSGPAGAGDDFVELYNNSDSQVVVQADDASPGVGLFKMGADCNATPVLIGTILNGTIIPARGHYLFVGSAYSLGAYATGDQTLTADIEDDRNVAFFSTTDVTNLSTETRLDAVGFGANTGNLCDLLREGTNLGAAGGSTSEHSFFRKLCDFVAGTGCTTPGTPKDTNDNAADSLFADTFGTSIPGLAQRLGAPGPENLASPIKRDATFSLLLLDQSMSGPQPPNRVRDLVAGPPATSTFGTMSVRRRVLNNTGGNVTRLRFRIVEFSTFPAPSSAGTADLRAITSAAVTGVTVNDGATCAATGTPATAPCTVTVEGTTLEQPPNQPSGGGLNSTLAAGTITLGTPLATGASVNVQFLLGVQQTGTFRFLIIIEALP